MTPIHHVVIVIGENRSFDNLFATYQPPPAQGQTVFNLLSEGIVNPDGGPGPNFQQAAQKEAIDTPADKFMLSPPQTGSFTTLPQPSMGLNLLLTPYSFSTEYCRSLAFHSKTSTCCIREDSSALLARPAFERSNQQWALQHNQFQFIFNLLNYQPGYRKLNTKDNTGDPMHRFYQNWQQSDCALAHATKNNPSGCLHDLYTWVAVTVGWGTLDTPPPASFGQDTTFQGGTAMGFYNMANGDLPYMKSLADQYALSDNYHQFMFGGTGPNSITTGTAAPLIYSDANGNPATPPADQIENPNAYNDKGYYPNNNNWYWNDGFWIANTGNASNGSYSNCADATQPGVAAITDYLNSLPYKPFNGGNCH